MDPQRLLFHALPILIAVWTVVGRYRYQILKRQVAAGRREVLLRMYRSTVIGEVVGSLLAVGAIGPAILGIQPEFSISGSLGALELVGSLAVGVPVGLALRKVLGKKRANKPRRTVADVAMLLPLSQAERWWFAAVSLCAGVGEELMFRGFGFRFLNSFGLAGIGLVAAGAVAFGLAHSYQGLGGVLLTGIIGLLLGIVYSATGSLIWPMILHALLDLRILLIPPDKIRELQSPDLRQPVP
jgi:membrane protease YdiL (CAAX protease family)